jgi:hypothetical protein
MYNSAIMPWLLRWGPRLAKATSVFFWWATTNGSFEDTGKPGEADTFYHRTLLHSGKKK